MNPTVRNLVENVGELVSLPEVALQVNRAVDDPRADSAVIGGIIARDPALTARLLRLANSALYARSATIDTVARAVTLLGRGQLRSLVVATAVGRTFEGLPNELCSLENFWRHSLRCALAGRFLARTVGGADPEVLFTAGMLHDIGELVIFSQLPGPAREALELTLDSPDEPLIYQAERRVMGFDHGELGGELARQWQLPPVLVECIAFHHEPQRAGGFPREAALTHIANGIALMAELDTRDEEESTPLAPWAWECSGLERRVVPEAVAWVNGNLDELLALFLDKEGGGTP